MHFEFRFLWTIAPSGYPLPVIHCPGCASARPFQPSGKIRLNANGKLLDCWIIYKCSRCDCTWNRPVVERRPVASLPRETLAALHSNDLRWAEPFLHDSADLRRHAHRIEQPRRYVINKSQVSVRPASEDLTVVKCQLLHPCSVRLDRLLACELAVPRSRLPSLLHDGQLAIPGEGDHALRRPLRDGLLFSWRGRLPT